MTDFETLRSDGTTELDTDVLIVGSGAGGSTVATTAMELGLKTLILEEGPYVPASHAPKKLSESFSTIWRNGGLTPAYGAPTVTYAEGSCVGGTTEINSAIFQRAPEQLLAEWATKFNIHEFGAEKLAPHYDWAAKIVNASPTSEPLGRPTEILEKASKEMGWQTKRVERGQKNCVGTNMCTLSCPTGGKQSMSTALIPKILASGARLISEAKVRKLLMKAREIIGVTATAKTDDGRTIKLTVHAKRVFICAGPIQTPALLQANNIRGLIGRTLRMHPVMKCLAIFNEEINAQDSRITTAAITEFMPESRMGGSIFTPATFGLSLAEDWSHRQKYIKNIRNAALYYCMVRAKGLGRIYAMPGGAAPLVYYMLDPQDWQELGKATARLGKALLKAGAKHTMPSIAGHPGWTSHKEIAASLEMPLPRKKSQLMAIHMFGSCRIGEDESRCSTDSFGRVHGTKNLYLADASLIPEAPGVNPQATVMAIARRNALHIMGEHR